MNMEDEEGDTAMHVALSRETLANVMITADGEGSSLLSLVSLQEMEIDLDIDHMEEIDIDHMEEIGASCINGIYTKIAFFYE